MRKLKIVILLGILILYIFLLTGCGYGKLKGIVIDKKYKEEYTTIHCVTTGKTIITTPIHHPATWNLHIQKEENGEIKTTWVSVGQEYYNKIQIGDEIEL